MKKILLSTCSFVLISFSTAFAQDGMRVGSTNAPDEMLHVEGAILIGNTSNTHLGTIRWNSTTDQFEGYTSTGWVSLSSSSYTHPTQLAIDVDATNNGINVIDHIQVNTLGHVTTVTARDLSEATPSLPGVMSAADKTKLNGIATNATANAGTVTSVAALTLGTTGTDLNSSVATGTTTPVITLNVPTASAANRGALSSTDWSTFSAKESALTFSTGLTRTGNTITSDLSTGIAGGQAAIGGTAAGETLRLSSTTDGTKGKILLGTSAYDEVNNRLGIGNAAPTYLIDVKGEGTPAPSTTDNILGRFEQTLAARGAGIQVKGYRNSAGNVSSFIDLTNQSSTDPDYIVARVAALRGNTTEGSLLFYTNSGTVLTERMRISSTGAVNVNALGGNATKLIQTDNLGNLSVSGIDPTTVGTVTGVTGTAPIVSSGGTAPAISIPVATSSANGYLSSADWTTFNSKQATISTTSPITLSGASVGMVNQGTTTTVLHGNASGNPSFGQIVNGDIANSTIDLTQKVTGILPILNGGTNTSSLTGKKIMVSNAGATAIVEHTGLAVNSGPIYTDGDGLPTLTAPTTGEQGYWTRTGTKLYNTNWGDNVGIGTNDPKAKLHVDASSQAFKVGVNINAANSNAEILGSLSVVASNASSLSSVGAVAWNHYNAGNSPSWSGTFLRHYGTSVATSSYGLPDANSGTLVFQNVSNGIIASNGAVIHISPLGNIAATFLTTGNVGIGTSAPLGRLDVKGSGSTTATYGLGVRNSLDAYALVVRDDGYVGIGTIPSTTLDVGGTNAVKLPVGTTAQQPTPAKGMIRYNSDFNQIEFYNGTDWRLLDYRSYAIGTGGAVTEVGGYRIHRFTSSGTFTVQYSGTVEVLAVAGGGGGSGSAYGGGGGGAGGVIHHPTYYVSAGAVTVTVGAGGASNTNGGDSFFGPMKAFGGGSACSNCGPGGSGGGTTHSNPGGGNNASTQTSNNGGIGYGNYGGAAVYTSPYWMGTGGGAGAPGGYNGMAGGAGIAFDITGTSVTYAGGGGQCNNNGNISAGGAGGGGSGGNYTNGGNGAANTGGGGGGSRGAAGGSGGSGVVIVRYPIPY